jgi:hypothetical protein
MASLPSDLNNGLRSLEGRVTWVPPPPPPPQPANAAIIGPFPDTAPLDIWNFLVEEVGAILRLRITATGYVLVLFKSVTAEDAKLACELVDRRRLTEVGGVQVDGIPITSNC